jgi:N-acetyltransferase 10
VWHFLISNSRFKGFPSVLALSIDESAHIGTKLDTSYTPKSLTKTDLDGLLSPWDLKRLESYANNMLDYHVILDLVPRLALLYFSDRLKSDIKLTGMWSFKHRDTVEINLFKAYNLQFSSP